jgi:galactose mutarotase-like enzyme
VAQPQVRNRRGWSVVALTSADLDIEVVPGKGGDILSVRWRAGDVELLWQSPWGLRAHGAMTTSEDEVARLIEAYPGGWQSVFPNGGDAVTEHGVGWGMHGEVWQTPFDWSPVANGIEMRARLVRSPFEVVKTVVLDGPRLSVSETITNVGGEPIEVMWSQHPAFGAPLVGPDLVIETAARAFIVDDARDTPGTDVVPGARGTWPLVPGRGPALVDGSALVDVSRVPAPGAGVDRMGYLGEFIHGHVALRNPALGLSVELDWDAATLPYAWYWLECHASAGFPWYRGVYVLAIEPASSMPAQGIAAVRAKTGTQILIAPGESRTATVDLTVRALSTSEGLA